MAAAAQSAEARALAALPTDVLRIILQTVRLEDRLRLELVDKEHRDALREPELWQVINLGAMRALSCTEAQFLCLLSRIDPRMHAAAGAIRRMAAALDDITASFLAYRMPNFKVGQLKRRTRETYFSGLIHMQLDILRFLYQAVPESWGPLRSFSEACTLWLFEQLERIPRALRTAWALALRASSNPAASASAPLKRGRECAAKRAVFLDVSGAACLPPNFLAACVIALSAVGYQVNLNMDGESDPGFLANHPVMDVIQILALDCSFSLNVLISGSYPWIRKNSLKPFNPWGAVDEAAGAPETIKAKLKRVAESFAAEYQGAPAAYQQLVARINSLVELRRELAAGGPEFNRGASAKIASRTVIIEYLVRDEAFFEDLLEELWHYLQDSPSRLRLIIRNCSLSCADLRALCDLLGARNAGRVTFQHYCAYAGNPGLAGVVLSSGSLHASEGLRALDLDLALSPPDLDLVIPFLYQNAGGARVSIHLRPEFLSHSAAATRQFFAKLQELCASLWGSRVTIVRHGERARLPNGTELSGAEQAGTRGAFDDAFLTPLQRKIQSGLRFENALRAADVVIYGFCFAEFVFGLVLFLDYLSGLQLFRFVSGRMRAIMMEVFMTALPGWGPLRGVLQGERDWTEVIVIVVAAGLPAYVPLRALYMYLGACLVWTVVKQIVAAGARVISLPLPHSQ